VDKKIINFIQKHHVLSCAFLNKEKVHSISCFYLFANNPPRFIVASNTNTLHVKLANKNPNVSGTIHLETTQIGKIQGIQFNGTWTKASMEDAKSYLKKYPYALPLNPKLWCINIKYIKFTDNTLGFGKKLEFISKINLS